MALTDLLPLYDLKLSITDRETAPAHNPVCLYNGSSQQKYFKYKDHPWFQASLCRKNSEHTLV